ncbi:MAG TPA: hypothetical protein VMR33_08450 [Candidatus Baltobacteraceae bacterium]|nr:hypothetical protein [Candidatus Baltobacteraceae bacterium]
MQIDFYHILASATALGAGALIGFSFGTIQKAAARRNQQLQSDGQLKSGWAVMPGSMRRVAYLLVALAGVQFICPLLFTNGCQWWVSGGVVVGYGAILLQQLRRRRAAGQ